MVSNSRKAFLGQNDACESCHRAAGTARKGTYAPDLTHLMSRQTLAAGMVPNTPGQPPQMDCQSPGKSKPSCPDARLRVSMSGDRKLIVDYLLTLR